MRLIKLFVLLGIPNRFGPVVPAESCVTQQTQQATLEHDVLIIELAKSSILYKLTCAVRFFSGLSNRTIIVFYYSNICNDCRRYYSACLRICYSFFLYYSYCFCFSLLSADCSLRDLSTSSSSFFLPLFLSYSPFSCALAITD